jgi:hypothetical protein
MRARVGVDRSGMVINPGRQAPGLEAAVKYER